MIFLEIVIIFCHYSERLHRLQHKTHMMKLCPHYIAAHIGETTSISGIGYTIPGSRMQRYLFMFMCMHSKSLVLWCTLSLSLLVHLPYTCTCTYSKAHGQWLGLGHRVQPTLDIKCSYNNHIVTSKSQAPKSLFLFVFSPHDITRLCFKNIICQIKRTLLWVDWIMHAYHVLNNAVHLCQ